jgi:hypothetical protein
MNIFKTKDNKELKWCNDYFYESNGYTTSLHVDKLADKFKYRCWQNGDPLGYIKIEGNGINIILNKSEGNKVNLKKGRGSVVDIGYRLMEKYNMQPDYKTLHELFEPVFTNFYNDFYIEGRKY